MPANPPSSRPLERERAPAQGRLLSEDAGFHDAGLHDAGPQEAGLQEAGPQEAGLDMCLAEVALPVPLHKCFDYLVPDGLAQACVPGARVLVSFGRQVLAGVVVSLRRGLPPAGVRMQPVLAMVESSPLFTEELLHFLLRAARYYMHPVGEVLKSAAPGIERALLDSRVREGALPAQLRIKGVQTLTKKQRILRLTEAGRARMGADEQAECARSTPEQTPEQSSERSADASSAGSGQRLGPKQRLVLAWLHQQGEASLPALVAALGPVHASIRRLETLGLVSHEETRVLGDLWRAQEAPAHDAAGPVPLAPRHHDVVLTPHASPLPTAPTLTPAQQHAVETMLAALDHVRPSSPHTASKDQRPPPSTDAPPTSFLLHGVTGSGKTEVYLRILERAKARGLGALVLIPEIALTPQLVQRFRARLGDGLAVLHSGLKAVERHAAWKHLRAGTLRIAIGVRSAIFAPVAHLGVVIVDEEHDSSFKQEEGFRYHARDMALLRAQMCGAICVLGSATPSLETWVSCRGMDANETQSHGEASWQQRPWQAPSFAATRVHAPSDTPPSRRPSTLHQRLAMPERATPHPLPHIEVVDLRAHRGTPSGHPLLTAPMHRAITATLAEQQQVILFLNRRGFAPSLQCGSCGEVVECPGCSVSLTEHQAQHRLRCHYCDFARTIPKTCPACGAADLSSRGFGTEQLEQQTQQCFPEAKVARFDRDVVKREGHEATLRRFRRREIDILVGTQMIAKGHDLPGVGLVGVLLADQSLSFPDFRSSERTFQLLSQVAGRAGRGEHPGRVILQTFQPQHPAIEAARRHDVARFLATEATLRSEAMYPPFAHMIAIRGDAADEALLQQSFRSLRLRADAQAMVKQGEVQVLGPAPAPLRKLRSRYRFHMLLRARHRAPVRQVVVAMLEGWEAPSRSQARLHVDVDPISMM